MDSTLSMSVTPRSASVSASSETILSLFNISTWSPVIGGSPRKPQASGGTRQSAPKVSPIGGGKNLGFADPLKVIFFDVGLIDDIADQFLEYILEGEDTENGAKSVDNYGKVLLGLLEVLEKIISSRLVGNEGWRFGETLDG